MLMKGAMTGHRSGDIEAVRTLETPHVEPQPVCLKGGLGVNPRIEGLVRELFPLFHDAVEHVDPVPVNVAQESPAEVLFESVRPTVDIVEHGPLAAQEPLAISAPMMCEYFFQYLDLFHQLASHHERRHDLFEEWFFLEIFIEGKLQRH